MRVGKLIEKLRDLDPETFVVLSRDEEGNGFSPLEAVDGNYNYHNGDIGLRKLTPELESKGYGDEDVMHGKACVVLWP